MRRDNYRRDKVDTIFSASATTGPTSRSASRRTTRVSLLRISTASAVQKDKVDLSSPYSQSPSSHRLSRSQMGTSQCRATAERAPRPPHASRPTSHAAFPPVPTPCLISLVSDSTSRRPCAEPTAPARLGEVATHNTHVPVTSPADRTGKNNSLYSRARSVGCLAQFGVGLREPARGDGKCHQAPWYSGALVTKVGSS